MTGDEFRVARTQSGFSIRAAATYLGTTATTIQRWESGASRIPSEAADRITAESRDADVLTKSERQELTGLLRRREKVAKSDARQRSAELLAEFEEKLATLLKPTDDAWADVVALATQAMEDANALIAERCRERGIPEDWHPGLMTGWRPRGENAMKERRDELRKVAVSRVEALERAAVAAIERRSVEAETALVSAGLRSSDARALLGAMPSVDELMPSLDAAQLAASLPAPLPAAAQAAARVAATKADLRASTGVLLDSLSADA